MKTLIAYASKTGTTESCARRLSELIEGADVVDLQKNKPNPYDYELVVVGGSIRAGMLHGTAKKYIKNNAEALKGKKLAFFVCSADTERAEEYFRANISAELLDAAVCADSFGGEMDLDKQKGLFKLFVKKIVAASEKKGAKPPQLLPDRIESFAEKLKELG